PEVRPAPRRRENQVLIRHGGVALAALLGGHVLGSITARFLRARNFDAVLRMSNASPAEGVHGFTPTFFAGMLVRLTVWSAAGSWLARQHGWIDLAGTLGVVVSRSWALAGVLVGALALGAFVVRRL